jgi:hypothetical protein
VALFPRGTSASVPLRFRVKLTTAPDCGGVVVDTYYYCEKDAANVNCAANAGGRYERDELLAADSGQWVQAVTTSCYGGGSDCGIYLYFGN